MLAYPIVMEEVSVTLEEALKWSDASDFIDDRVDEETEEVAEHVAETPPDNRLDVLCNLTMWNFQTQVTFL